MIAVRLYWIYSGRSRVSRIGRIKVMIGGAIPGMKMPVNDALAVSVTWFSRILTLLLPLFATARSAVPSPLKSADAIATGVVPTLAVVCA